MNFFLRKLIILFFLPKRRNKIRSINLEQNKTINIDSIECIAPPAIWTDPKSAYQQEIPGKYLFQCHDICVQGYNGLAFLKRTREKPLVFCESVIGSYHDEAISPVTILPSTNLVGKPVLLINEQNYYHFITEDLPKVLIASEKFEDFEIYDTSGAKFVDDVIKCINPKLKVHKLSPFKTYFIEKYIFSNKNSLDWFINPMIIHYLRNASQRFNKSLVTLGNKRPYVYISRLNTSKRQNNKENHIVEYMKARDDVLLVEFEKLGFLEQINMIKEARKIIGFHGAGFTNILWGPKIDAILEFYSKKWYNSCYQSMAATLEIDHAALDVDDLSAGEVIDRIRLFLDD